MVSAQESRDWHSEYAKSPSEDVRAVSVDAVIRARTRAIDDSGALRAPRELRAPGHCFVDYRGLEPREVEAVRASLYMASTDVETEHNADALFADQTPG